MFTLKETKIYTASASVLVDPPVANASSGTEPNMATEDQVAESSAVAQLASSQLRSSTSLTKLKSGLSVSVPFQTNVLIFKYASSSPRRAAARAQAFAQAYVTFRENLPASQLSQARTSLDHEVDSLTKALGQVTGVESAATDPNQKAQASADAASILNQIGVVEQKLANLNPANVALSAKVVQSAVVPSTPSRPSKITNGVIGFVLACLLGLAAGLIMDRVDNRIRDRRDLEARLGVPVWASIPYASIRGAASHDLVVVERPESTCADRFLEFGERLVRDVRASCLAVTSASGGEGKSFVCANLAVALTRSGFHVIIVSANVADQRAEEILRISPGDGLTDVLTGKMPWEEVVVRSAVPNLSLLRAGSVHTFGADTGTWHAAVDLFQQLHREFDYVLLDGGSMLSDRKGLLLTNACEGTIFVASGRKTKRRDVDRVVGPLRQLKAPVICAVLLGTGDDHPFWSPAEGWSAAVDNGQSRSAVAP